MITSEIIDKMEQILGKKYVSNDPVELYCYSHDYTSRALSWIQDEYRFMADLVIKPQNADQVKDIIDLANHEKIKLIPRGAGTSFGGQTLPFDGGVVVDFGLMNKILEVNTEENYVIVEPGVLYKDLSKILNEIGNGYWIPCNPGSADVCTIGGMIANNASGESAIKYGTTRDYTLNVKVITGSGQKIQFGRLVKKSVSGLDLLSLFVGSEGILGLITEATLKFISLPEVFTTILAFFNSKQAAFETAKQIKDYITPMSLEFVDQAVLSGMNLYLDRIYPKLNLKISNAAIIVRIDGDKQTTAIHAEKVKEIFDTNEHASSVKILSGTDHEYLWKARDCSGPSLLRLLRPFKNAAPYAPAILDFAIPFSKMIDFFEKLIDIMKTYNIKYGIVGHLGDGNLHITSSIPLKSKREFVKIGNLQEELVDLTLSFNGTITAEHGCGIWKAPYLPLEHGKEQIELMKRIKSVFDPNNILNPGKMVSPPKLTYFPTSR
ncbi:MAG: FAD-binding protein [Candidatus Lokiarchaeota archaeon]|nr:FAD-binding protein [Candidatus Lokiarchaeota archaeon]MBD3339815.1 FAD-binding protein [Candidatus Lokiarchaeota archaeon]